jgi:hypothetical protein
MGRALAFSDAEIVRMATEDFVAVTGDDWYQRRRQDAEGEFFRKVSDQAGRGSRDESGGSTRQGIYCFTASGRLLAYKNAGQAPDVMRELLRDALSKWRRLPESERRPGAVKVQRRSQEDARYAPTPPPGGLVLNVYTRLLDRDDKGELCDAACRVGKGDEAARDHLWITETEWKSLVPATAKEGDQFPLPARLAERLCRFHLVDNTRGEPPMWGRDEIRSSRFTLTVESADSSGVRLRLDGAATLSSGADSKKAERGYDVRLLGYVNYNAARQAINQFDIVAVGDHWGEGPYTRGARPGRTPLGVAFELATGKSPADRVPPQAAREIGAYLNSDR